jgi:Carboxypeptidase regulatory-like domain
VNNFRCRTIPEGARVQNAPIEARGNRGRHRADTMTKSKGWYQCLVALLLVSFVFIIPIARSQPGITFTDIVKDEGGAPVVGASVRLYSSKRVQETIANNEGRFEFANVEPGKYELEVRSPGFNSVTFKDIEISDRPAELPPIKLRVGSGGHCMVTGLGGPGESRFSGGIEISYEKRLDRIELRGLVRDDLDAALVGVNVKLEMGNSSRTAVSNSKGEFEFSGVEPGKYILTSSEDGFWDISRYVWIAQENLSRVIVTLPNIRRVGCYEFSGPQ